MTIDLEILGIGITALTPVYGGLWYLVSEATRNKTNITNIQSDILELKSHIKTCKYCSKGGSQH